VPLTREAVVTAAVRLLRQDGLDALSLRKLAAELQVSAPTLYWHVRSKRELLDLVADRLVADQRIWAGRAGGPAPDQPWWEWLRERAERMFDSLVATRDAPRVVAGTRPTVESLPWLDQALGTLIEAGFPPGDAQQALFAIGSYVIGSATDWQGEAARAEEGTGTDAKLAVAIRTGQYPHLAAAVGQVARQPARATFEFGLGLIIDGLRVRYQPAAAAGLPARAVAG
jgi:TetR/AcrR family tetracycline transcriptional repressor